MGILLILPLFIIWPVSFVEGERRGEGRGERRGGEGRGGEERRGEERGGRGERGAPRPQHQGHGVTFGPSFIDPLASIFCRRREERRGERRRGEERRGEGRGRGEEERRRGGRERREGRLGPNIKVMGLLLILPLFIIWTVSFVEGERWREVGRGGEWW